MLIQIRLVAALEHGADTIDQFRRSAAYVDHILRGEKAGDLVSRQNMSS
jgi:hypothetical protein